MTHCNNRVTRFVGNWNELRPPTSSCYAQVAEHPELLAALLALEDPGAFVCSDAVVTLGWIAARGASWSTEQNGNILESAL